MRTTNDPWSMFSNHGLVFFHIAANPHTTLRELSDRLGITERQVGRIVKDLGDAQILMIQRQGRRNTYTVNPHAHLHHPTLAHISLQPIIRAIVPEIVGRDSDHRAETALHTQGS